MNDDRSGGWSDHFEDRGPMNISFAMDGLLILKQDDSLRLAQINCILILELFCGFGNLEEIAWRLGQLFLEWNLFRQFCGFFLGLFLDQRLVQCLGRNFWDDILDEFVFTNFRKFFWRGLVFFVSFFLKKFVSFFLGGGG